MRRRGEEERVLLSKGGDAKERERERRRKKVSPGVREGGRPPQPRFETRMWRGGGGAGCCTTETAVGSSIASSLSLSLSVSLSLPSWSGKGFMPPYPPLLLSEGSFEAGAETV